MSFPVYKLDKGKPERLGTSLIYHEYEASLDDYVLREKIYYVDDTSRPGDSIGRRRLHLRADKLKLARIGNAIMTLRDLTSFAKNNVWFVDNKGIEFQYIKTTRAKLTCAKLTKITPVPNSTGVIVEVDKIPVRFKLMYVPREGEAYVGILEYAGGYMLYGLYTEPFKDTWRKV